jgi:hypothetical protein
VSGYGIDKLFLRVREAVTPPRWRRGSMAGPSLPSLDSLAGYRRAISDTPEQRKLPDIDALIARAELVESWLRAAADCKRPSLTILEG